MYDPRGIAFKQRFYSLDRCSDLAQDEINMKPAGVTSGVTSNTLKPVPPVVRIRSMFPRLAHPFTAVWICDTSSGTMAWSLHSNPPRSRKMDRIAGPARSFVASLNALSPTEFHLTLARMKY